MNYYIGDLHFNHKNIINLDSRPFNDIEEMENILIKNWNSVVKSNDHVYILGDFCWGKVDKWVELLDKLNGLKYLIIGNHDDFKTVNKIRDKFVGVYNYLEIKDQGYKLVLCHYPIASWNGMYKGTIHLYAHVHNTSDNDLYKAHLKSLEDVVDPPLQAYNVGCMIDYMNYTPRTLEEIIDQEITKQNYNKG